LFAPAGASWNIAGATAQSSLDGKDYFSVAVLPDNSPTTLNDYAAHAFAFVNNTTVTWNYDSASALMTSTFTATTDIKEGSEGRPLMALYRHQWLNSSAVNTSYIYQSPRGEMKVARSSSFSTAMTFNGVLPSMPDMGTYDEPTLYNYVNDFYTAGNFIGPGKGTYWTGKDLGRAAMLVRIAEQTGHTAARDALLAAIKSTLENWLSAPDGETANMFYYNSTWGTLIGYPAEYGSDKELNDHYFHYGYYILAAATVAQYDSTWASDENWGGMINLLIDDVASINNPLFPRLRNFDPYAGHGWASGHGAFAAGNNQESSSEAMMFNTALILWGAATGNTTTRDLGIFQYTNESRAIEQYWFDVDNVVFPATFNKSVAGILWGQGVAHATWWTANPEEIHGINFLPITGGSLYLGRNPAYIPVNYNEIVSENGGTETEWRDIIWSFQAFQDPAATISKFGSGSYTPEDGESKAHTYHWLHNLNAMGQLDTTITADIPTYAVFNNAGTRTYVAYNPGSTDITVSYSNGVNCEVPAKQLIASTTCVSGPTNTPGPTATASNTPTITLTPTITSTPTITNTVTITRTPTITLTPGPASTDTLYVIDGASLGVNSVLTFTAGSGAQSDTIPAAGNGNHIGTPNNPLIYVISNVNGTYNSGSTSFSLYIDSLTAVGNAIQARVSYDLNGDNTYDRVETYNYFPTNDVVGYETYTQAQGQSSPTGSHGTMTNGKVKLELWTVFSNSTALIRTSATSGEGQQSRITIPYVASVASTATPTQTATQTESPTETATVTATATDAEIETPTATVTATATETETESPTETMTPTTTATATETFTPTPTITLTVTSSATATATRTATPTATSTSTATFTSTATSTRTHTPTITPTATTAIFTLTLNSIPVEDGWILESSETSGVGGTLDSTATTFRLGDEVDDKQYRTILSFNTTLLPDTAVIQTAQLKIKQNGLPVGTDPFTILGSVWADIRTGTFGAGALELADFNSAASVTAAGAFNSTPVSSYYTLTMNATARNAINKLGRTQMRLRFGVDDNNDALADYMKFLSGDFTSGQPQLIITYTLP
jgi:hypothetical protein